MSLIAIDSGIMVDLSWGPLELDDCFGPLLLADYFVISTVYLVDRIGFVESLLT